MAKHLEKSPENSSEAERPDSDETQTSCVAGWELY